jgi:hypothetical protein
MRASRRDQFLLISAGPEKAGWLVYGEAPCFGLTFTPNSSTSLYPQLIHKKLWRAKEQIHDPSSGQWTVL